MTNYNTFIVQKHNKGHLHYIIISLSRQSQKTPIMFAEAVWPVKLIPYLHRKHFCTLLFLMREFVRDFSQQARALNSSERLWLVIALINATESCVWFEFSSW